MIFKKYIKNYVSEEYRMIAWNELLNGNYDKDY